MVSDDTTLTDSIGVRSADKMRPWNGQWQTIGGWQSLIQTALTGVCRGAFGFTDYSLRENLLFGTHSKLQVLRGGALTDITPLRPNETLTDPFTTTNLSAVVEMAHVDHQLSTGNSITVSGASAVGGITPNGAYTVTVVDDNSYTITHGSAATSSATGGGTVTIAAAYALKTGKINGTGGAGYGTGGYGAGTYGQPGLSDNQPRTWSFGASGETPYANPRGYSIYHWDNNTSNRATVLTNAPARVEYLVTPTTGQVVALGCTNQDGDFDPLCIRWSDGVDRTIWTTATDNNAGQYVLSGSGRIVAGRVVGPYIVAWTDVAVYLGRFTGFPDGWVFDLVAEHRGLIGPNAAAVFDQIVIWLGGDRKFYRYSPGGLVEPVGCPVSNELASMPESQRSKVIASTIAAFSEVWFFFPKDSLEVDRAISVSLMPTETGQLLWSTHDLARTWFMDVGPTRFPIGVSYAGAIYHHERGQSDNGGAMAWHVKTKAQYIEKGQKRLLLSNGFPDLRSSTTDSLVGAATFTFKTRDAPQGAVTESDPITVLSSSDQLDFFLEGRMIELEISGETTPTDCRIGKLTFDAQPAGEW